MLLYKKVLGILLCCLLITVLPLAALAAPETALTGDITEFRAAADGTHFTLAITADTPNQPYAALDFSLVSADPEHLFIEEKVMAGQTEKKSLQISFTKPYGSAYHPGRLNDETGALSYLMGIFSPSGQNDIAEATEVCRVALLYTGEDSVDLSLDGLKLVYMDEENTVQSVQIPETFQLAVAPSLFNILDDESVPLAGGPGFSPLVLAVMALSAALVAAIVVIVVQRRKKVQKAN